MKKIMLLGAFALFGAMSVNAQTGFKLGVHAGLPTGDASEVLSFNAGVDLGYTWRVAENFDLGLATGYSHYFWKSEIKDAISDLPNMGVVPVAATAQYNFNGGVFVGADLGYAFLTAEGSDGGFYYQPKLGYTFQGKNDLYVSYKGISQDGSSLSSFNLGYAFRF